MPKRIKIECNASDLHSEKPSKYRISGISLDDYEGRPGTGLLDPDYVSENKERDRVLHGLSEDDRVIPLDRMFPKL